MKVNIYARTFLQRTAMHVTSPIVPVHIGITHLYGWKFINCLNKCRCVCIKQ